MKISKMLIEEKKLDDEILEYWKNNDPIFNEFKSQIPMNP